MCSRAGCANQPPSVRPARPPASAPARTPARTAMHFLEFEKPVAELEGKIEELRHLSDGGDLNIVDEVRKLQDKVDRLLRTTYARLTPSQKVQVARHPARPHCVDYIQALLTDFTPLAGDRLYAE